MTISLCYHHHHHHHRRSLETSMIVLLSMGLVICGSSSGCRGRFLMNSLYCSGLHMWEVVMVVVVLLWGAVLVLDLSFLWCLFASAARWRSFSNCAVPPWTILLHMSLCRAKSSQFLRLKRHFVRCVLMLSLYLFFCPLECAVLLSAGNTGFALEGGSFTCGWHALSIIAGAEWLLRWCWEYCLPAEQWRWFAYLPSWSWGSYRDIADDTAPVPSCVCCRLSSYQLRRAEWGELQLGTQRVWWSRCPDSQALSSST